MKRLTALFLCLTFVAACQSRHEKAFRYFGEGLRLVEEAEAKNAEEAQEVWKSAQANFKAALMEERDLAEAHYYLGLCNLKLGWTAAAEEEIKLALRLLYAEGSGVVEGEELDKLLIRAHNSLGEIHMQKAGISFFVLQRYDFSTYYFDEGMKQFQQALKIDPNDRATLRNIRYHQMQAARAMQWLRRQLVPRQRT